MKNHGIKVTVEKYRVGGKWSREDYYSTQLYKYMHITNIGLLIIITSKSMH